MQSAYQRLIALSQTTAPNTTITLLLGYLDTFYTDPAGWSLLAELYADQGLYAQSLAALGHVMLINTWDSIAVCRAGETAYTMGCVGELSCELSCELPASCTEPLGGIANGSAVEKRSSRR